MSAARITFHDALSTPGNEGDSPRSFASQSPRRADALGPGIPGSNVAVLRQGAFVFVAYLEGDGGTSLVRLDATSGVPTP